MLQGVYYRSLCVAEAFVYSPLEEAKKSEAEDVLKKLLASGMSADEIVAKLQ